MKSTLLRETVVVLGTGSIGKRHLAIFQEMAQVQPVAVSVRSESGHTLEESAAALAVIATDTGRHAKDALRALHLGMDLLVEKPLAVDARQARQIHEEAMRLSRKVYVGCVLRFSESLGRFRENLPQIGKVHAVQIECRSYLPDWRPNRPYQDSYSARAGEGGVLRDLIHEIDYAGWIFGWPTRLQARLGNLGRLGIAAEETAQLMWETPEGATVSVGLDYLTRPTRRGMVVSGERGTLEWDGVAQTVRLFVTGSLAKEFKSSQTRDEMFAAQARAFLEAVAGRPDPRLATGEEGVKALAICDAARKASVGRREEPVESFS